MWVARVRRFGFAEIDHGTGPGGLGTGSGSASAAVADDSTMARMAAIISATALAQPS